MLFLPLQLMLLLPAAALAFPRPMPMPLALALAQSSLDGLSPYLVPQQPAVDVAQPRDYNVYKPEVGRVKIQVYRGPNKNKCPYGKHYCEEFAPWGYYNTQPADAKKKKGYH